MANCIFLRTGLLAASACLLSVALIAQDESRPKRNTFVIGGGVGLPTGDLKSRMSPAALVRIGYGYRVGRYFQMDTGLDVVAGAAGINITQQSLVGELRIHDVEYMVPFGGRAILPLAADRFELFAGGGGLYLRYDEEADISGLKCYGSCYYEIPCPSCTSRSGWGYYGTARINFALDRRHRVWLGLEARYVKGTTSGTLLSTVAGFETEDRWLSTSVNLAFRF